MSIQILPARLANQIAAGEVVERPASVVKELVENSLDSGASRIDIDIEKGGSKLIRVRDNGQGIPKQELTLALSRHATSKIKSLDDLEAIVSLGFRGEALASISAVARLTLTSRTATQEQAWSAYSEGRDMDVTVQPASHPIGTTVEVLDLFFNTPARRKFLRTDKTEFSHIDELLKRIALSRFDVTINLKHNGKVVRQYRAAKNESQIEKRVAAVCGTPFVKQMLSVRLSHQGLTLHGWISSPQGARQQNDLQFCYVNGRMMRDKLINHAIRQSYENSLGPDQFASYVLFIEIDPHQVDVNVHPAKHEVRFHESRLVHDFIYVALSDALVQGAYIQAPQTNQGAYQTHSGEESSVTHPVEPLPAHAPVASEITNESVSKRISSYTPQAGDRVSRQQQALYQSLLSEPAVKSDYAVSGSTHEANADITTAAVSRRAEESSFTAEPVSAEQAITRIGKALNVVSGGYLLVEADIGLALIALHQAARYRVKGQLRVGECALTPQPLLVPLSIKLDTAVLGAYQAYQRVLNRLAIELTVKGRNQVLVMGVPQPLRQHNLQQLIPNLLSYLASADPRASEDDIATWLAGEVVQQKKEYTLSEGIQILSELEQIWDGNLPLHDLNFIRPVSLASTIAQFEMSLGKKAKSIE